MHLLAAAKTLLKTRGCHCFDIEMTPTPLEMIISGGAKSQREHPQKEKDIWDDNTPTRQMSIKRRYF